MVEASQICSYRNHRHPHRLQNSKASKRSRVFGYIEVVAMRGVFPFCSRLTKQSVARPTSFYRMLYVHCFSSHPFIVEENFDAYLAAFKAEAGKFAVWGLCLSLCP